jgi:hypothetical protein
LIVESNNAGGTGTGMPEWDAIDAMNATFGHMLMDYLEAFDPVQKPRKSFIYIE